MSGDISTVSSNWGQQVIGKETMYSRECIHGRSLFDVGYAVSSLYVHTSLSPRFPDVFGSMYGVTLGQAICYAYWFPNDPWFMKALVCLRVGCSHNLT